MSTPILNTLTTGELPEGFAYPPEFLRVAQLGITNLEPWSILDGDGLRRSFNGLQERFPARKLVPFAARQDNDDVACWEVGQGQKIFVIHDFASPGWEKRGEFPSFWDWFRSAIEDFIGWE